jgi:hypothetical protein
VTFTTSDSSPTASAYYLWVGTTSRGHDLINMQMPGSSAAVPIPANGQTIYVTLWSLVNGTLYASDYTYTASSAAGDITSRFSRNRRASSAPSSS